MAAIDFPNSPSVNDTFTVGGVQYVWNGVSWRSTGVGAPGPQGPAGAAGDRFTTSSTTSNTIGTGSKTFTVETGLSLTATQNVQIVYDGSNFMEGPITSYNSGTGELVVNVTSSTGSGTYTSWTITSIGGFEDQNVDLEIRLAVSPFTVYSSSSHYFQVEMAI